MTALEGPMVAAAALGVTAAAGAEAAAMGETAAAAAAAGATVVEEHTGRSRECLDWRQEKCCLQQCRLM
jgi:hypothetical protein